MSLFKAIDNEGNLKKVWVEMELPEGDYLACLESAQKTFHAHMAGTFLNGPAIIGKNDSYQYKEQVKAAVGYLSGIFAEFETCCDPQGGFRSLESCSFCTQKIHDFRTFMEANGFIGIEVENLVVSTYFDTTGSIRAYTSATAVLAGDSINVNADVIGFLNRMDNAMDGIYGSLYYYDPLEPVICKNILEVVAGPSSPPIALKEGGVTRSSLEEVVMDITTIITVDKDGGEMVHVKVDIPLQMTNTGKTIYLQCLDDCGFDMNSIKNYLENFYTLLGKYGAQVPLLPDFPKGPYEIDSVQLIPDIQISTQKLTKEIVRDGVVVLFGEVSKIIESAAAKYKFSLHPNYHHMDSTALVFYLGDKSRRDWNSPTLLESASGKQFSMVKNNDIHLWLESFRSHSKNHLASFLAFHATGHNADIKHFIQNSDNGQRYYFIGYMSEGPTIMCYYLGRQPYNSRCYALELSHHLQMPVIHSHSNPPKVVSLEELVGKSEELFENKHPSEDYHPFEILKRKLYERYIK